MFARAALLACGLALLSSCATTPNLKLVTGAQWAQQCADWDEWEKPAPPFRIYGNSYYVGTCGIASIAVVGDDGIILIDSGTEAGSAVVEANLEAIGHDISDVRALLVSHEHWDHVGGMARLQKLSGATVYAGWGASPVLRSGVADARDPQAASLDPMAPVATVRSVADGETGEIAGRTVTPITTPGHTPGALSWVWEECEEGICKMIVFADSLGPVSSDDYRFSDHPDYVAAFRKSLDKVAALDCDILITPHPSASGMRDKLVAGHLAGEPHCTAYAESVRERLEKRLASERDAD